MKRLIKKLFDVFLFSLGSQLTVLLLIEIAIGICVSLFSLYLFLKIGDDIFEREVYGFDTMIMQFVYTIRSPLLTQIMDTITFFGGSIFLVTASLSVIIILFAKKHYRETLLFSFIFSMGVLINLFLKGLFARPRPEFPLVFETTYSFPSGHAMNAMVFYFAIAYLIFHFKRKRRVGLLLFLSSMLVVISIGISRIYLGAHYPSDVLAGYVGGFCWVITVLIIDKSAQLLRLYKGRTISL